jgi:PiT family inorganic phosphate transporter
LLGFILPVAVFILAYLNGANDISKGIATLVGSSVMHPRRAILWGAVTTIAGALAGVAISGGLLKTFSSGVLATPLQSTTFPVAVAVAAIGWIFFATQTGLPVSTTHALTGGIIGAALSQLGSAGIVWNVALQKIAIPLALSPVLSFALAWLLFPIIRRSLAGVNDYCLCVELQQTRLIPIMQTSTIQALAAVAEPSELRVIADKSEMCEQNVALSGVKLRIADSLHVLTGGLTSFARGLNDTPKIAALLVGASLFGGMATPQLFGLVALGMCAGSLLGGRKVLATLSEKITAMDGIEGFAANLGSSVLVATATFLGLPLSTTHVTTSAIVGIGVRSRGRANWRIVRDIATAWLVTLPTAALLAYLAGSLLLYFGQ